MGQREDVLAKIDETVKNNKVVVYMKGTPMMPQCGFSAQVAQIFGDLGVEFTGVNVIADPDTWNLVKEYSNWPTIPQIFISGEFIGGCDIATEMHENGELKEKLVAAGILK